MKKLYVILLAIISCVLLTSCPSDGEDIKPGVTPEKEYNESINIPANGYNEVYHLYKLNSKITSIVSTPDWLTVSVLSYSSGYPSIKITALQNSERVERTYTVILYTEKKEKLMLTITQAGKEIKNDIGDIHNNTSSKPAYSLRK